MTLPSISPYVVAAAGIALVGIPWVRHILRRIPEGDRFLVSTRWPTVEKPERLVPVFAGLWILAFGLWLASGVTNNASANFFALLMWLFGDVIWLIGFTFRRQLSRAQGELVFVREPIPAVELVLDGTRRRVELEPGGIRAWTVGNGISGPQHIQVAIGRDGTTGIALFVLPAMRHWALAEGASWLNTYAGVTPVARGADLLDRLAPFTVPANADWKPPR